MRVQIVRRAEKELLALPLHVQRRFKQAIEALARDWPVRTVDVKRLQGNPNWWRLRVGNYRALFQVEEDRLVVTAFTSRSTAYR